MAVRNYDGSVTLKTRGALAYTPSVTASTKSFIPAVAAGGLTSSAGSNGRLVRQKGAGYAGRSAYS